MENSQIKDKQANITLDSSHIEQTADLVVIGEQPSVTVNRVTSEQITITAVDHHAPKNTIDATTNLIQSLSELSYEKKPENLIFQNAPNVTIAAVKSKVSVNVVNKRTVTELLNIIKYKQQALYKEFLTTAYLDLECSSDITICNRSDLNQKCWDFICSNKKVLTLFGDSGAGKSLFLINRMQSLIEDAKKIPVLIQLNNSIFSGNRLSLCIPKYFKNIGLTEEEITLLKEDKNLQWVFCLDGYDEKIGISSENINLYQSNNISNWGGEVQIVITCRNSYVRNKADYRALFMPYRGGRLWDEMYQELFIAPFSSNQIERYIDNLSQNKEICLRLKEKIQSLLSNPLSLYFFTIAAPRLEQTPRNLGRKIVRSDIYQAYIDEWFEREVARIAKAQGLIKLPETIINQFKEISHFISAKMFILRTHVIEFVPAFYENEDVLEKDVYDKTWEHFLQENDPDKYGKMACPLKRIGENTFGFMHNSLKDYFFMSYLFELLKTNHPKLPEVLHSVSVVEEYDFLQFLSEKIQFCERIAYESITKKLLNFVIRSREISSQSIAATNAITMLNFVRYPFSNLDLSKINAPGANLSGAILSNTKLTQANLQSVIFSNAYLHSVDLTSANLNNAAFDQLPSLGHSSVYSTLAASCDGSLLYAGRENNVEIWSLTDLTLLKDISIQGKVSCITISPTGEHIAIGSHGKILIFNNDLSTQLTILNSQILNMGSISFGSMENMSLFASQANEEKIICMCFSPDGKYLITGGKDRMINCWDVNSGKLIQQYARHKRRVTSLQFLSWTKDEYISGGMDGNIYFWDLKSSGFSRIMLEDKVTCLATNTTKKMIAIGTSEGEIILYYTEQEKMEACKGAHERQITFLQFNTEGTILYSASEDELIKAHDIENDNIKFVLHGHMNAIKTAQLIPNSSLLVSAGLDKGIKLWNVNNSRAQLDEIPLSSVLVARLSPDQKWLAVGDFGGVLKVWYYPTMQLQYFLYAHEGSIFELDFSPDSRLLATCGENGKIKLWSIEDGKHLKTLNGHNTRVNCIKFTHDGKYIISGGWDSPIMSHQSTDGTNNFSYLTVKLPSDSNLSRIRMWEIATGTEIGQFREHDRAVSHLLISSDDEKLLSISHDHTLRVWLIKNRQEIMKIEFEKGWLISLCCSIISPHIIACGDYAGNIDIVNIQTNKIIQTFKAAKKCISNMKFLKDKNILVYVSYDKKLRLLNIETGQILLEHCGHNGAISALEISQDNCIITGADDHTVKVWNIFQENNKYELVLKWSTNAPLFIRNCVIDNSQGLSKSNRLLFNNKLNFSEERQQNLIPTISNPMKSSQLTLFKNKIPSLQTILQLAKQTVKDLPKWPQFKGKGK